MNESNQAGDGYDAVIVGGGIVGAATLYQLQQRYPDRTMLLIEKEAGLADHQTGNNSGVIHSGLYYPPGSLKAKNCVEGRRALVRFAQEHNIPHNVCGKVVVAVEDSELSMLEKIHGIGQQNEIEGLERINTDQLREIEPHCKGIDALWVPCTGIIDYRAATKKMALPVAERATSAASEDPCRTPSARGCAKCRSCGIVGVNSTQTTRASYLGVALRSRSRGDAAPRSPASRRSRQSQ